MRRNSPRAYPVIARIICILAIIGFIPFPRNVRIYRTSGTRSVLPDVWSARASEKSGAVYFGMTGALGLLV